MEKGLHDEGGIMPPQTTCRCHLYFYEGKLGAKNLDAHEPTINSLVFGLRSTLIQPELARMAVPLGQHYQGMIPRAGLPYYTDSTIVRLTNLRSTRGLMIASGGSSMPNSLMMVTVICNKTVEQ
jgi:hypothetical protein